MAEKIKISVNDGRLVVKGTLNLGYIGTYTDGDMSINRGIDSVRRWKIVKNNLSEGCTDEEIAAFLSRYYSDFAEKIERNIDNINGTFLLHVFSGMVDCGLDFWEIEEVYLEDKDPYGDTDEIYDAVDDKLNELWEHLETPNDGSVNKPNIEQKLRELFPMFDFDTFFENIIPESVGLDDGEISFQCSDDFGEEILCGAYDVLDEKLCFTDWHNY